MRATWSALCLCVGVAGYARTVVAATPERVPFGFEYLAEPALGCPTHEELRNAVVQRLEYDPFSSDASTPQHRVRVVLARVGRSIEARIEWVDVAGGTEGERRLASVTDDCSELARGLVFALAVQIQLRVSNAATEPEPRTQPLIVRKPPPPRPLPPRSTDFWLVGVGSSLRRGWAPGTSLGFNLAGALSRGRGWLEAGLEVNVPRSHALGDGSGFDTRVWQGWLASCVRTAPFGWCATATAGRLSVHGRGVDHPLSPSSWLAGAGGQIEVLWPEGPRFGALLSAQLLATLTPRDVVLNRSTAWTTAPVTLGISIDVVTIFR